MLTGFYRHVLWTSWPVFSHDHCYSIRGSSSDVPETVILEGVAPAGPQPIRRVVGEQANCPGFVRITVIPWCKATTAGFGGLQDPRSLKAKVSHFIAIGIACVLRLWVLWVFIVRVRNSRYAILFPDIFVCVDNPSAGDMVGHDGYCKEQHEEQGLVSHPLATVFG